MSKYELYRYDYGFGGFGKVLKGNSPRSIMTRPGCAQVVLSDPPYNIGLDYAGDRTNDALQEDAYRSLVMRALRAQSTWMAPGATCWWVVPISHAWWIRPMMEAAIGPALYTIAWHETFSQYNRHNLTPDFRMILVHTNDPKRVFLDMDSIRVRSARQESNDPRADPRGRIPGTVWKFRRLQGTSHDRVGWHPAQLPPELLQRIIRGWSAEGDIVLDGFAGSGSMGVEALKLNRRFIGVDRSSEYIRKIDSRLSNLFKLKKEVADEPVSQ